ncbi:hypothetical protein ACFQGA_15030 [Marinobacter koreensis]|jgi:uncharacterized membrane-anchored protein|uniref:Membrane-anchored protein n=1 Tax=Marinobacter koreensis TaxID=335974 RepID=A0ABW0RNM6_9GAMM|nr:hypothetical protein [Marinobacter koreensis]MCK7549666.1 hypothetical protein [Marinobacter koreensis]
MNSITSNNFKQALLRVPEVTLVFWIIKTLSTTVGETGADFLAVGLNWGMPVTAVLMVGLMVVLLYLQFGKLKRYVPANYWTLVVLMSVIGTLITDMLVDLAGVSLGTLSTVFTVLMLGGFYLWYREEGTLSIHSIDTGKREAWYWVVILLAFALGTAVGDLISEHFALGYDKALLLFSGLIAAVAIAHYVFKLNAIAAFWFAYVLTRPLGASLGDFMIQAPADGGLGVNMMTINIAFLTAIVSLVGYELFRIKQALLAKSVEAEID